MNELEANTEVKVRVGPFVDVGDGFTPETGITLGGADEAELLKHNGVATVDISGNTWAAIAGCDGWYDLTLTTTDTNTEGLLTVVVQDDSVCLPVHVNFTVLAQAAWDSKYTAKDTGYMDVNVKAISEDTAAADNCEADYDGTGYAGGTIVKQADVTKIGGVAQSATDLKDLADTGYDPSTHKVQGVVLVDTCTANTDMRGTDSAALASSWTAALATVLGNYTAARAGYLDELAAANIPADIDTLKGYCDILDDATNGLANIKSLIDTLDTVADAIKAVTDLLPDAGALSDLATILADTNELQTDWTDGGRLDLLIDAITTYVDLIDDATNGLAAIKAEVEGLAGVAMRGTDNAALATALATHDTEVKAEVDANETKIDTVDTVVDGIQTDLSNATDGLGALKALLDAIQGSGFQTATDSLVAIHDDHVTHISADYGAAQKALIDALPSGRKKGVAIADFPFQMRLSSDHYTAATGKTITCDIKKDNGDFTSCTNSATETQTTGIYTIDLTATEMNANIVTLRFSETDCDTVPVTIMTT